MVEEGGDRYYHGSLRGAGGELDKEEIPAEVHVMGLGGQNANKLVAAIRLQHVAWIFLNASCVQFRPSLPAFACEAHLGGRVEWSEE
jgi:hypothetical protein